MFAKSLYRRCSTVCNTSLPSVVLILNFSFKVDLYLDCSIDFYQIRKDDVNLFAYLSNKFCCKTNLNLSKSSSPGELNME